MSRAQRGEQVTTEQQQAKERESAKRSLERAGHDIHDFTYLSHHGGPARAAALLGLARRLWAGRASRTYVAGHAHQPSRRALDRLGLGLSRGPRWERGAVSDPSPPGGGRSLASERRRGPRSSSRRPRGNRPE